MNKAGFIGRLFIKYSFQGVDSFFKRRGRKNPSSRRGLWTLLLWKKKVYK